MSVIKVFRLGGDFRLIIIYKFIYILLCGLSHSEMLNDTLDT